MHPMAHALLWLHSQMAPAVLTPLLTQVVFQSRIGAGIGLPNSPRINNENKQTAREYILFVAPRAFVQCESVKTTPREKSAMRDRGSLAEEPSHQPTACARRMASSSMA